MSFSELEGHTLVSVEGMVRGSEEILFTSESGERFKMWHKQDCCEHVSLDDVCGDPSDLVGTPIVIAEETCSEQKDGEYGNSETWTFYHIRTMKGTVSLRWYGSSNGYYSERAAFAKLDGDD